MRASRTLAGLAALLLALPAAAQPTPLLISHSGFLLDASDQPVTGANLPFTFRIYDQSSPVESQTLVWSAGCSVSVSRGYYAVLLGSAECGDDLASTHLPPEAPRYLEVTLAGTVLLPRHRFAAAPVASVAVTSLDTSALANTLSSPGTLNEPSNPVEWSRLKGVPAAFADGSDDGATYAAKAGGGLSLSGTEFELATSADSLGKVSGGSLVALPNGSVGIGITPTERLEVAGTVKATAFVGSGAGLTNLSAAALTGTLPEASLPANVARLDGWQAFTGGIRLGSETLCNGSRAGTLRWSGSAVEVCDGNAWTRELAGNDAPVMSAFAHTVPASVAQGSTVTVRFSGATDPNGDPVTYAIDAGASGLTFGKTSGIAANENVSMTAPASVAPATAVSFTVSASDGRGGSASATVNVTIVGQATWEFTAGTASWSAPAGGRYALYLIGGGGGGYGSAGASGGGGGGAYFYGEFLASAISSPVTVTVGAAGKTYNSLNPATTSGGASSFGSYATAGGGQASGGGTGGAGGTVTSSGLFSNVTSAPGGAGGNASGSYACAGGGGAGGGKGGDALNGSSYPGQSVNGRTGGTAGQARSGGDGAAGGGGAGGYRFCGGGAGANGSVGDSYGAGGGQGGPDGTNGANGGSNGGSNPNATAGRYGGGGAGSRYTYGESPVATGGYVRIEYLGN